VTKILIADLSDGYTEADFRNIANETLRGLILGVPMSGRFPETTIAIRSESPPTDYFDVGSMMVVSARLRQVLESFQARAEFLRLNVETASGPFTGDPYYCCNILQFVDCVDRGRSELTYQTKPGFTDRIDMIQRLAIDEAIAGSHPLFRLAKGAEYLAGVSDGWSAPANLIHVV
jgi:hypothetical protein